MATEFRDSLNRPWTVALTVASAKRVLAMVKVKDESGQLSPFDLIDAGSISLTMTVLSSRYLAVCETMYALVKPQVEKLGLDEGQFYEGLTGDALADATKVIEDELINFFPPRLRKVVGTMFRKGAEVQAEVYQKAEEDLEKMDVSQLEQFGKESTKPQESLA